MALSGLDIYKKLPKTNCKKCGAPTCLAFAMKLAAKKASIDECPDVSQEAKEFLAQAAEPPIRTVIIGEGDNRVQVGGETVLFRHEKTFFNPTAVAILVSDNWDDNKISNRLKVISDRLHFERVGQEIGVNLVTLKNESGDKDKFLALIKMAKDSVKLPFILMSDVTENIQLALEECKGLRPLICCTKDSNIEALAGLAKDYNSPLVVSCQDRENCAVLAQKLNAQGFKDIVLDPGCRDVKDCLDNFTQMRRLALKKNYRPVGYPIIAFVDSGNNMTSILAEASVYIAKYASIIVLDSDEPHEILPLLTLRQNIYTDPQKPVMVEPKIYEIGPVSRESPIMVTTNFSLTFFTVQPEIEASKIPAYLLITDSDGLSVLTAWAAEKFTAEIIADSMKKSGIEEKLSHRKIIIPGYVAVLTAKLKDESGWEVMVGPKEASGIPKFLKETWK